MIERNIVVELKELLEDFPAVVIIGPRQVGKTTLAQEIAFEINQNSIYLDLETPSDLIKLSEPEQYFDLHEGVLVILDEIQRTPEIFQVLRGVIDRRKKKGLRSCQFLILGSASLDLMKQSSESLAGRIAFKELFPFNLLEIWDADSQPVETLWLRGGFPDSFLSKSNESSLKWRTNFITTYLERDIPLLAQFIPANKFRRLWTMLAHQHGAQVNMSQLGASLDLSSPTVANYIGLLEDLLLVRNIRPWFKNIGKRLVKSPKVFIRDSGLVHALLNIPNCDALLSHPVAGASWEGFVIENMLSCLPKEADYWYFKTSAGAEIDLVLEYKLEVFAIEIKRTLRPKLSKGFLIGCEDIGATQRFFVYGGQETFPIGGGTFAISLHAMMLKLASL